MIGDRWYVWGQHWTVCATRRGEYGEQEVQLVPDGAERKRKKLYPFVAVVRVERHGVPSGR